MTFLELAKTRYSVRKFTDKPIKKEKLDLILQAANVAPTAKNQQPQRIYVLQSEDALAKLSSLSPCVYGAKTVLLFAYNTAEEWQNPLETGVHSGIEDVSIVATHAMLQAAELGLGTCWCNYFPNQKLEELLGLPENEKTVLFLSVGYTDDSAVPAPAHENKKSLSDTIKYL